MADVSVVSAAVDVEAAHWRGGLRAGATLLARVRPDDGALGLGLADHLRGAADAAGMRTLLGQDA